MIEHITDLPLWTDKEAFGILKDLCEKHKVTMEIVQQLVAIQRERQSQERADGIYQAITEVLDQME